MPNIISTLSRNIIRAVYLNNVLDTIQKGIRQPTQSQEQAQYPRHEHSQDKHLPQKYHFHQLILNET